MTKTRPLRRLGLCSALVLLGPLLSSAAAQTLSPAEQKAIDRAIARIHDPRERQLAQTQPIAWQVAEFLCRPAARPVLARLGADGNHFFLRDVDPHTQILETPSLLRGEGSFRLKGHAIAWKAFHYLCHLDPATARILRFEVDPKDGS
ncbi:hypothetical protein [Beijerinckia mobilis]|uniref:hypothetical protein n=1 Tax=Beijerinckia mobilis TaxID=231434 RepID=UPI0012ECB5C1|nr:hypothetical protein [Beijerinckia mobilis]